MSDRISKEIQRADDKKDGLEPFEKILQKCLPDFQQAMPHGREAVQLFRDAMHCLRTTKGLAECTQASILGGLMTCAQLGLRPGVGQLGEAWLIPYKRQATLMVGYRGYINLAYKSTKIKSITGAAVRRDDEFECAFQPPLLIHKPPPGWDEDTGPVVGYYAAARLINDGLVFWRWGEKAAEAHRQEIITAANFRGGPWLDHPEPMKIKQCVRRIWKWLPHSLETEQVEAVDGSVRTDVDPSRRPEDMSSVILDGEVVDGDDDGTGPGDPAARSSAG